MARSRDFDDDEDDDDAPWLAEAEPERRPSTLVARGRLLGGIAFAVLLLLLVVVGVYLIASKKQGGADGAGFASPQEAPLIPADPGPYKIRPTDPGGLSLEGEGGVVYDAGAGENPSGQIDLGAAPEEPLPRPGTEPAPTDLLPPAMTDAPPPPASGAPAATVPAPAAAPPLVAPPPPAPAKPKPQNSVALVPAKPLEAKPAAPRPAAVAPAAPGAGTTLQLGAFSTSAKAEAAWKSLSGRYAYLAGLTKQIVPVARDGTTLYRLRATGAPDHAAALDLCARLKVAGDSCIVTE